MEHILLSQILPLLLAFTDSTKWIRIKKVQCKNRKAQTHTGNHKPTWFHPGHLLHFVLPPEIENNQETKEDHMGHLYRCSERGLSDMSGMHLV